MQDNHLTISNEILDIAYSVLRIEYYDDIKLSLEDALSIAKDLYAQGLKSNNLQKVY